jgi:septal ring factor EnvC (AmiA/AmiB activator)
LKLSENTVLKLDLKTIVAIILVTASFVGMYYTLQADIEEAKKMPPAEVKRIEYDLREEWNEKSILTLTERIHMIEQTIDILSEEIKITSSMLKDGTENDRKFEELNKQLEELQNQEPQIIIQKISNKRKR